jgi:hypothetical protein
MVFNPVRLGVGSRAAIGQDTLSRADRVLTEIVVPGDFASDYSVAGSFYRSNPVSCGLYDSVGPLGNARRFAVQPRESGSPMKLHNMPHSSLEKDKDRSLLRTWGEVFLPEFVKQRVKDNKWPPRDPSLKNCVEAFLRENGLEVEKNSLTAMNSLPKESEEQHAQRLENLGPVGGEKRRESVKKRSEELVGNAELRKNLAAALEAIEQDPAMAKSPAKENVAPLVRDLSRTLQKLDARMEKDLDLLEKDMRSALETGFRDGSFINRIESVSDLVFAAGEDLPQEHPLQGRIKDLVKTLNEVVNNGPQY